MATMEAPTRNAVERRPYFSAIRWSAVFGGLVAGVGTYIVLTLFGVAVGLSFVNLEQAQYSVSLGTGIWSGVCMLIAAFIGGFVSARMSGLLRAADGYLHGFVTWGAMTLLFAYLATTTASSIVGGTLGIVGQVSNGAGTAQGGLGGAQEGQQAVSSLMAVSWWLFASLAISIVTAMWGGRVGIKPNSNRIRSDHASERR